jgi:tetratricopeptide (TPR) repeat protein
VVVVLGVGLSRDARGASNDVEAEALVQSVLEAEYTKAQYAEALEKLELAQQACSGGTCSPKVRAKVFVAIGTVLAALKQDEEAKNAFASALKDDPTATLFGEYLTPEAQKAFNDARGVASASSGTGSAEAQKAAKSRGPKKKFSGGGRPPRGWRSAEAAFYWGEALKSQQEREWVDCADYAQASLAAENRAATRFVAATCEQRGGLWIEAIADYRIVADTGDKAGLRDTASRAKQSLAELTFKIPKVVLHRPAKATDLVVTMNDQPIANDKLEGEIWVNPGQRTIAAKGKVDGVDLEFEQVIEANEGETVTIDLKLLPKGLKGRDTAIMKCMLSAQTREDFQKCLSGAGKGSNLNWRLGSELSGYHDTDHVDVVSPTFFFNVESPTGGWGVGASFLVDVVTAASVDVVASASPRWREARYAPAVNGHKKFGDWDVSGSASLSDEPDYVATSVGAAVSLDLANKTITPKFGYQLSYDVAGVAGTPFSVYSNVIVDHAIDASTTFVLNKSTILSVSFTGVFEVGDSSKPYRYVPLFSPDVALSVPVGFAIDSVNDLRLPVRPLEQLPTNRQRYALSGLLAHRFSSSTIRGEERVYSDSWGIKASTTSVQYFYDVTKDLRVWPQARFNAQTAASFWQLAYEGLVQPDGSVVVPTIRTGNRELSPLIGITGGFGVRYAFGAARNYALTVTGDVAYDKFFDALYILERVGFLGSTTIEVELE